MARVIATGEQSFVTLRENALFYVDKTKFIKEWWCGHDSVTLITRPRRFGKTLMLDTVKTFFSPEFAGQSQLFEGLEIWQDEAVRKLQGTVPVISLSFASIKCKDLAETLYTIKFFIERCYAKFRYLLNQSNILSNYEINCFSQINREMKDADAKTALLALSEYIYRFHKQKPIILLDEYDSPLQAAWSHGYWDELVDFLRGLFNSTFKTNEFLERGLITGITRISKESIFSDLNNLKVVGTTTDKYTDCFGFTEQEVFAAMAEYGLTEKKKVKKWYNGFIFGKQKNIYNPWSIIGYLTEKRFDTFWGQTSSNAIVGRLIAQSGEEIKKDTTALIQGSTIVTYLDEQIVFSEINNKPGAIWSFLMAAGYVKPINFDISEKKYEITLTNYEVHLIFESLISSWFTHTSDYGRAFRNALIHNNVNEMNKFLSEIAKNTFIFLTLKKLNRSVFTTLLS